MMASVYDEDVPANVGNVVYGTLTGLALGTWERGVAFNAFACVVWFESELVLVVCALAS
jgi:hypothetical protein